MALVSFDKWKMLDKEKFNSFSESPRHKLICLQKQGLKLLLRGRPCIFPTVKEQRILIAEHTDSYLALHTLSLQAARLLSSHGELM